MIYNIKCTRYTLSLCHFSKSNINPKGCIMESCSSLHHFTHNYLLLLNYVSIFIIPVSRRSTFNFIQLLKMSIYRLTWNYQGCAPLKGISKRVVNEVVKSSWNLLTEVEKPLVFPSNPAKTYLWQQKPVVVLKTTEIPVTTCSSVSSVLQSWLFPLSKVDLGITLLAFF